ncbi:hypothetical protein HanXRQr2_Chr12g0525461 [Helianthus annuus]|uniref:Uncharacterized protein n=1 Tax=Helianthus annuus TaxID=4232 RepID=A0A9K3HD66_HELAN|nr:hypothetical protein HanXRQr2_Chr12g0525461 [Helianthus annuus]KAJ0861403.1 hypothetical protein HanPSC8_Chr12g0506241 [Helianthus annuus]
MFISTNILIQYLSCWQFHDCGHITHWLTRCPIVTNLSVVYTKPHILAGIVEYKDSITVSITKNI